MRQSPAKGLEILMTGDLTEQRTGEQRPPDILLLPQRMDPSLTRSTWGLTDSRKPSGDSAAVKEAPEKPCNTKLDKNVCTVGKTNFPKLAFILTIALIVVCLHGSLDHAHRFRPR
eukprot:TRINITY_DN10816_c0_g1_i10.p5 TRINITY_DN10816_c0_g1~~TRINITY_DN10816_c0_g1_i10.p5  ORF type:complete len:115 (+),score=28.58 TRINITY_DN10816_c0_g1_i10:1018-1362(+)